jgi:hypothetical protein
MGAKILLYLFTRQAPAPAVPKFGNGAPYDTVGRI